jgi:secreted PhoX family phosphatase
MYANEQPLPITQFPLAAASTDDVRALEGLGHDVVVTWLEPLTSDPALAAPHFGATADYLAYFGDGWNSTSGNAPQWHGSSASGWMWSNHEYVSGVGATLTTAPVGEFLTLAKFLRSAGALANDVTSQTWTQEDVDILVRHAKRQVGGSWMRVVQDPATRAWDVDRTQKNVRYDATSNTLTKIVGYTLYAPDHDDAGVDLPAGVVAGITGDCSGAQTPWGTVISGEENVQDYYGDLEACWDSNQKFVAGRGCDSGAAILLDTTPSTAAEFGKISNLAERHAKDGYGWLVEIDPGQPANEYYGKTSAGVGHRKIGSMGRARWENATFAVDASWKLLENQPIVVYASDDRRGGRIYKFVSSAVWTSALSKAQSRALLDSGKLYVAHFAGLDNGNGLTVSNAVPSESNPGSGKWIELSVSNATDDAPNAPTLGVGTKVGAALSSNTWNGMGGFPNDNAVLTALFTASNKIGVKELNRPEDIEYNPVDRSGTPRLYVAFTNHTGSLALDANGVLDPATTVKRADSVGAVWALEEAVPATPASSGSFKYFQAWSGAGGTQVFDAANPDNVLIDRNGGVWFGTDGNYGKNKHADAVYYLDLDPAHRFTTRSSYGKAFRVAAVPSDAEATGPAFSSDMTTLFINVQHPGESIYSSWPQGNSVGLPELSSTVAVTLR